MPTKKELEVRSMLSEPFTDEELEWRIQRAGEKDGKVWAIVVPYVQSRAIMERLDDVLGIGGWEDSYETIEGGFICTLTIRFTDDEGKEYRVSKSDASDRTDIEAIKGGISGALKRTAVKFGIGRYLYDMGESFAVQSPNGSHRGEYKKPDGTKVYFKWDAPKIDKGKASVPDSPETKKVRETFELQPGNYPNACARLDQLKANCITVGAPDRVAIANFIKLVNERSWNPEEKQFLLDEAEALGRL